MRLIKITCASLALAVLSAPAAGATSERTVIIGTSPANDCFRAVSQRRQDADAIDKCTLALNDDFLPREVRAVTYVNRAILRLRRHDSRSALGDANAALALHGALSQEDAARAYFYRANAYEDLGDNRAAYADYRHATELSPNWAAPRSELARFQIR